MNKLPALLAYSASIIMCSTTFAEQTTEQVDVIAEQIFNDTTIVSPTSTITTEELEGINFVTSEDAIAYEPSVIIRRRYIGDSNGTVGIRGSNMFQTTRTMVFADGLPLHYLLQTSFSGSPRWSLVGPDEIDQVDVIYGPFSAEYSGNSMGGVVNIKTRDPKERRVILEGSLFAQDYDNLSTNDTYYGGKLFTSYENKFDNLGVYLSFNHLENDSHPQTQFASAAITPDPTATVATGGINGVEEHGNPVTYYGDSGPEHVSTDLLKLKLNYDAGDYQMRAIVAYEQRESEQHDVNNFLRDATGATVWDSTVNANGNTISTASFGASNFQHREQERESLLLGAGLSGPLGEDWVFDIYATYFDILKDEEIRSGRNPADPAFAASNAAFGGRFTEYKDTGWTTLDVQSGTENLMGNPDQRLSVGYHFSNYELGLEPFRYNSIAGNKGTTRGASGGETSIHALYAQWGWAFDPDWDLALGLRYEDWQGRNGFFDDNPADGVIDPVESFADRNEQGFSPKFSLAHFFDDSRTLRYSVARALRFPVTEELYQNVNEATQASVANAGLEPEDGIHHNLMYEQKINNGFVRANLFYEKIDDVIFSQNVTVNGATLRTFLPVTTVETKGVEFVINQTNIMDTKIDARFNVSYIDAEIKKNDLDPSIEGNDFPRMPNWRANLLLGYPVTDKVDVNVGFRFASDSYGDLDNSDQEDKVFGAQDEYLFTNVRVNMDITNSTRVSVGVDNLFDEEAYVHHPWPSRTLFLEGKITF